jgi:hypothetical protein
MSVREGSRPRPWLLGALLVAVVLIFPVGGARAAARAKAPRAADVAAARRLIAAQTSYYQAGMATRREAKADVNAALAQIKATCPQSIPNSLLDGTPAQRDLWMQLFGEAADDVALAEVQPLDDATTTLAQRLDRLHFSRGAVNRDLRQLSHALRLSLTLAPSDLCTDLKAAAANGFTAVPAATTAFNNHVDNVLGVPSPTVGGLIADVKPDTVTKADRAAIKRLKTVSVAYTGFIFNLSVDTGFKLADVLGSGPTPPSGQAATTTAANTRSTSSSKEMPAASAASGSRLVSVSPGMGLTSRTYSSLVAASSMRSTRAKPAHPSSP